MLQQLRRRGTGAVLALALAVSGLTATQARGADEPVVLDHGHTDIFNVSYKNDKLVLEIKEDITGYEVLRPAESAILKVKEEALIDIPAGFPGHPKAYYLPQVQDYNLLWPGWDTLKVAAGKIKSTDIDVKVVSAPEGGKINLWIQRGLSGETASVLKSGGFTLPGTIVQADPAHTHVNWTFTKPGKYVLEVQAKGTKTDTNEVLVSNKATYTWSVGDYTEPAPAPTEDEKPAPKPEPSETPVEVAPTPAQPTPAPADPVVTPAQPAPAEAAPAKPNPAPAPKLKKVTKRTNKIVVTSGHFDMGVILNGANLAAKMKDDRKQPATWRTPEDLLFVLDHNAKAKLPASYSFIGRPGSEVWMIGSTQIAGVPWLGQNTQHPSVVNGTTGPVKWDLLNVSGPGKMFVFMSGSFGKGVGDRVFDNASGPKSYTIPSNTHAHPNWVFTKPGRYQVKIRQTATLPNGKKVSAISTLYFAVGMSASEASTTTYYVDESGRRVDPKTHRHLPGALPSSGQ